jgi:hypothetical protein
MGPQGPQGNQGPQGIPGPVGPDVFLQAGGYASGTVNTINGWGQRYSVLAYNQSTGTSGFIAAYSIYDSSPIAYLTSFPGDDRQGQVCAQKPSWGTGACLQGNGAKTFIEPHPLQPDKSIVYVALEGPEAAMYLRGTAKLVQGESTVVFPEHFSLLAAESGMTVTLTPHSADSAGLARITLTPERMTVQELRRGKGNHDFDYVVFAVRKRFEGWEAVRDKADFEPPTAHPTSPPK